jgi:Mn-dependent DtxR family transcriptional regulator
MGEEKRAFKGVWICAAIFLDERLTPAEKILLAEIDSLTSDDRGCYASNAHFAKRLAVTESRANHIVARLTRDGYIIRVRCDGRLTQRVVAPQYSSNPATSHRLIERYRRLVINSRSELSHSDDSNSELLKIATPSCQKQQPRIVENRSALLLEKVPTETTNRKRENRTTTTYEENKPKEASSSSRCASRSFLSGGAEEPAAEASDELGLANARGDALAFQLARDFRLTGKQRQTVIEYCESHGRAYVLGKAEVRVGLGARQVIVCERTFRFAPSLCDSCAGAREVKEQARKDPSRNRWERLCPG